jgi:hypothetical protein
MTSPGDHLLHRRLGSPRSLTLGVLNQTLEATPDFGCVLKLQDTAASVYAECRRRRLETTGSANGQHFDGLGSAFLQDFSAWNAVGIADLLRFRRVQATRLSYGLNQ